MKQSTTFDSSITNDMKNSLTTIATKVVEASEYTLAEIKADFKAGKSESWNRGFFAARGFDWLQAQIIIKGLL